MANALFIVRSRSILPRGAAFLIAIVAILPASQLVATQDDSVSSYRDLVLADEPVFYLDFEASSYDSKPTAFSGTAVGNPQPWEFAARPPLYPRMSPQNQALMFDGTSYLKYADSNASDDSGLRFRGGDELTLEAWVMPYSVPNGQQVYVVGKGRTSRKGFAKDNQNYALRIRGQGGQACLSFLFRNEQNRNGVSEDFHRWTSQIGFMPDENWHHIAVTYKFGDADSLRGFIDGEPVQGSWDMGGKTDAAPFVDDDEVWVASAMGGNPSSSFRGALDEVAIYRKALSADAIANRFESKRARATLTELNDDELPADQVVVEIFEGLDATQIWDSIPATPTSRYEQPWMALTRLPKKYQTGSTIVDRATPFLVRSRMRLHLPRGEYDLLVRAKSASRLLVDDQELATFPFMSKNASGHEHVPEPVDPLFHGMHPVAAGHRERVVNLKLDSPRQVVVTLEATVGGPGVRDELGEACVAIAEAGTNQFHVLTSSLENGPLLTESNWRKLDTLQGQRIVDLEAAYRRESDESIRDYWQRRHQWAKKVADARRAMQTGQQADAESNAIDDYLKTIHEEKNITPLELVDDLAFLRRVTLDTVGVIPSMDEVRAYLSDAPEQRRSNAIDRLLHDPRWADHWVSYWQDVLAENPGILKPELNNTGPFRFWIYESLLDNKPMDRFATELIEMKGSTYGGGAAGFRLATQNDVPMAAKALVLGQAFLGSQMECARCHDSPVRDATQEQLMSIAAMLNRQSIKLPATSSVPPGPDGEHHAAVTVSLSPGDQIAPRWPFEDGGFSETPGLDASSGDALNPWLRRPGDSREQLAWLITSPEQERFAQVIVNRLWARWMGVGLVTPVDDWENGEQHHAELLQELAYELVANNYDLKHVGRIILTSQAYQRRVDREQKFAPALFAGRTVRRLTAEQLVDSLYVAVGKTMDCEPITFDPEGRRPSNTFLNLGRPRRAWEFSSLSNERDRPALSLPRAQTVVDLLVCFGWRDSRPHGESDRDEETQLLQPLTLANGNAVHRVCQISDNGEIVESCLTSERPDGLVRELAMKILGHPLSDASTARLAAFLEPGFGERVKQADESDFIPYSLYRSHVSWSNHLSPEATSIMLELEEAARMGDPPTNRLQDDWRKRAEDVVWALVNSPEFLFMP